MFNEIATLVLQARNDKWGVKNPRSRPNLSGGTEKYFSRFAYIKNL